MKRLQIVGLFLIVGMALVFLCANVAMAAEKVIKLGLLLPMSGQTAPVGEFIKLGNQIAVDEINEAGGIKSLGGAKLELVLADHQAKPEIGIAEAERLVKEEKVAVLIGGYASAVIYTSSQVAEKYGIPYMVEGGTANNICERGFKFVFRVPSNSTNYAKEPLDFLKDMGKASGKEVKNLGLMYETTLYGKAAAEEVKKIGPSMGVTIVADLPYPPNSLDFSMPIAKLKSAQPDAVYVVPYVSDAILIVKTMKEMDFNCMGVTGTGGFLDPSFTQNLGKTAEYIFQLGYMSAHMNLPGARRFEANMKKRFGKPATSDAAYCYSAIYILRDALEKAGSVDGKKIRDALASLDEPSVPWAVCSITGVKYDEKGENLYGNLCVSQFLNGEYRTVWRPVVAVQKPIWPVPKWADRK
jgi:branched-chain amino acid transport system substrate-binding protein